MTADSPQPGRLDSCGRPIQLTEVQRTRPSGKGFASWTAPEDMPDHMVLSVFAGAICGALVGGEGDAKYCLSIPAKGIDRTKPPPYRCKRHGGIPESKARPGNDNARTFGMYASALSEEEKALRNLAYADGVDDEIALMRIRLKRAVDAEAHAKHELESYTEETSQTGTGEEGKDRVVLKKTKTFINRAQAVDKIVRQFARLVGLKRFNTMALLETTPEGVRVYLPDNGRNIKEE